MSGDRYKIQDQQACYFITMTVVYWIDVFSRRDYKDIIVESLNYCIANKGLNLYAWIIMSNHIHIVGKVETELGMSGFLRDFKKFTSKKIVELIQEIPESRRDWLLDKFSFEARRTGRAENYKLWKDDNHAIDMSTIDMMNKVDYIHDNPVRAGLVHEPDQYVYSSATDYAGGKGMVNVKVV
ncbi:transposase [Fulvivirga sp.]|uniref:REP-associated tyrosine transposase n=1 Tax=Fulvivirga sp. TaxID=1931237 RepID=UPI0032EC439D